MIPEEIARRERLEGIKNAHIDPYPATAHRTHSAKDVLLQFEELEKNQEHVTVAGRLTAIRRHGGLAFLRLHDASGDIQIVLQRDAVGAEAYTQFFEQSDIGDFYEFTGGTFVTKKGEQSLAAQNATLLTKTLLPLPEKFHGLTDTEKRYRHRYLDLIANESSFHLAKQRSLLVSAMRRFLEEEGFLEVETPILQPIAGGAAAKPFVTHHNSLHHDFYLRIAPELYLKRLLVGGMERVYEFARCFRNEGVSPQHNPEFTQVELYWAYATIEDLMDHVERMLQKIAMATHGALQVPSLNDTVLDFSGNLQRITFHDIILKETGIDLDEYIDNEAGLKERIQSAGVHVEDIVGIGEIIDQLWKEKVRPNIIQPTFVMDYPACMKPLAKIRPEKPFYSAGAQLLILGMEVMNAFNEQNDPLFQEEVFNEQEALREQGSEEAQMVDHDYIKALKHGMPPAAGYGIGIDRITMIFTGAPNIKEVILFPTLKPEKLDEASTSEDETSS